MEVHENVEEDNQTPEQDEGAKLSGREVVHPSRPLQRASHEAPLIHA